MLKTGAKNGAQKVVVDLRHASNENNGIIFRYHFLVPTYDTIQYNEHF